MKIFLIALLISLVFLGCKDTCVVPEDDYSYISDPWERWKAYGINNYKIEQEVWCFCRPAFGKCLVYVISDTVIEVLNLSDSTSIMSLVGERYQTITQLFKLIELNIDAEILEVEYDSKYGYPTSLYINYRMDIMDQDITIKTKYLQSM